MTYKPEYAKGEILVGFKGGKDTNFARSFGERIGYKLSDEKYDWGSYHIYKTKPGEEEKAIQDFKKHEGFVKDALLRTFIFESMMPKLDELEDIIDNLRTYPEVPDECFTKLDEFIKYFNNYLGLE